MTRIHNTIKLVGAALAACSMMAAQAQAQAPEFVPAVKTTPSRIRSLVVEKTYLFRVLEVTPPVRLTADAYPAPLDAASPPESVLQEQFMAMKQGDYARFMNTWTAASQNDLNARNAASKRDKAFWIAKWRELLPGKAIELRNFVVYARFVLIQYALVDARTGAQAGKDTVAFVRENGIWKMTQELAYDPVLASWDEPTGRIRVPPDSMIPPAPGAPAQR